MRIENDGKRLIADEGKVFMCTYHNVILGKEVYLKQIMKDGVLVEDSADNYIEVDEPERPDFKNREISNETENQNEEQTVSE